MATVPLFALACLFGSMSLTSASLSGDLSNPRRMATISHSGGDDSLMYYYKTNLDIIHNDEDLKKALGGHGGVTLTKRDGGVGDSWDGGARRSTDENVGSSTQTEEEDDLKNTCLYAIVNATCRKGPKQDTLTFKALWSFNAFPSLPIQDFNRDCKLMEDFSACVEPTLSTDERCTAEDRGFFERLRGKAARLCQPGIVASPQARRPMASKCYDMSFSDTVQMKNRFRMRYVDDCSATVVSQNETCDKLQKAYQCSISIQWQECGNAWMCAVYQNALDAYALVCPGRAILDGFQETFYNNMCPDVSTGGTDDTPFVLDTR